MYITRNTSTTASIRATSFRDTRELSVLTRNRILPNSSAVFRMALFVIVALITWVLVRACRQSISPTTACSGW